MRHSFLWIVVIVAIFGTLMSAVDKTIVNIAIPQMQIAFGADLHSVQWVSTSHLLAAGIGQAMDKERPKQHAAHFLLVAARACVRLTKPGARMSREESKIGEVFSPHGE